MIYRGAGGEVFDGTIFRISEDQLNNENIVVLQNAEIGRKRTANYMDLLSEHFWGAQN